VTRVSDDQPKLAFAQTNRARSARPVHHKLIGCAAVPREVVAGLYGRFARWAAAQPNARIGTSIEIPDVNVGETTVTAENARSFGPSPRQRMKTQEEVQAKTHGVAQEGTPLTFQGWPSVRCSGLDTKKKSHALGAAWSNHLPDQLSCCSCDRNPTRWLAFFSRPGYGASL